MAVKLVRTDEDQVRGLSKLAQALNYLFFFVRADSKFDLRTALSNAKGRNLAEALGISLSTLYNYIEVKIDERTGTVVSGPKNVSVVLRMATMVGMKTFELFYAVEQSSSPQEMFNLLTGFKTGKIKLVVQNVTEQEQLLDKAG